MAHCGYATASEVGDRILTLVCDPIDRIISIYNYWRGRPEPEGGFTDTAPQLAKELTFSEFIRSDHHRIVTDIDNAQAYALAFGNGKRHRDKLAKATDRIILNLAHQNLRSIDVVGHTENMGLFGVNVRLRLGLNLNIETHNVTEDKLVSRSSLDRYDMRRLKTLTELDRRVYDWVCNGSIEPDESLIQSRREKLRAFA